MSKQLYQTTVLSSGTVTFLFTDVEGSTAAWLRNTHLMGAALARHDELIEHFVAEHGGQVVRPRGEGDSRFAVFARCSDAVTAACAVQLAFVKERWPLTEPLRVRMAVHTGEADVRLGDYYGPAVNHCARLRAIAHGGQVLVSSVSAELVREALPTGVRLLDLGQHQLKDLEQPERVWQVLYPELPADFPPLTSLSSRRNNLPNQLSSFVGREQAIDDVCRLLVHARLLTLTGPAGIGKTRLALRVAVEAQRNFPDGVWLVRLDALADPDLVPAAIASALGTREHPGRSLQETITDALGASKLLLVLDNCEHLVAACSELADQLLRACPRVRILATSRQPLAVAGEQLWPVPPLSLEGSTEAQAADSSEAVHLFAERARLVQHDFALSDRTSASVAEICRRLDGIPLAIELAAARVRILGLGGLMARLDERLPLLSAETHGVPVRHRTLHAAIGWSYDLLSEPEQACFRRLSVFAGGWTLAAAEAICSATDGVQSEELLGLLTRLVDKSLVQVEPGAEGPVRFELLELIREYALEQLRANGEEATVRQSHAAYFLALAEEAEPELWGARPETWMKRLQQDVDNCRAALKWSIDSGDDSKALSLGGALERFWLMAGRYREGQVWVTRLLGLACAEDPTLVRAKLLRANATLWAFQGDAAAAQPLAEAALRLMRQFGPDRDVARALIVLGDTVQTRGQFAAARRLLDEAVAVSRRVGATIELIDALHYLSGDALAAGDFGRVRAKAHECLALARQAGYMRGVARARWVLGSISYIEHDLDAARLHLEASVAAARELNAWWETVQATVWLCHLEADEGDLIRSASLLIQTRELGAELGDSEICCFFLEGAAHLAAAADQPERALRLAGAAEAYREVCGSVLFPGLGGLIHQWLAPARTALGRRRTTSALSAGRALSLEQAMAEASAWDSVRNNESKSSC